MDGTGHAEAAEEEAWAAVYSAIDRAFEPGSSLEIPTAQLQAVKEVRSPWHRESIQFSGHRPESVSHINLFVA